MECLVQNGVEVIFGMPGAHTMAIYDALHRHPRIKHILVRHEESAALMADGYSRATGKVGVCCVTTGPGVTNAATGLAVVELLMLGPKTGELAGSAAAPPSTIRP